MRSAIRPTRWRRLLAAVAISFIEFFLVEREGRAEPATYSSRLGGAAAAGRTMVRSTAAPSPVLFSGLLFADSGSGRRWSSGGRGDR